MHLNVILRDLHFFGLQAAEDYLEGKLSQVQYEDYMNEAEHSLERYLAIIRKIKKFPTTTLITGGTNEQINIK